MPAMNSVSTINTPEYSYLDGNLVAINQVPSKVVITTRTTVNTPGFGRYRRLYRKNPAYLPMNNFTFQHSYSEVQYGEYHSFLAVPTPGSDVRYSGNLSNRFGYSNAPNVLMPHPDDITDCYNYVVQKMLSKMKDLKVNLMQVYAERMQVANMIEGNAKKLRESILTLKRGKIRDAASVLGVGISFSKERAFNRQYRVERDNAVSRGWLELQYGWKPLLGDIYGSAEFLAKKHAREITNRVSSKAGREYADEQILPTQVGMAGYQYQYTHFDYRGVMYFETTGVELASAKEAGLTNPALLAWELLPYSFVVDWFLPVGNYLNTLDADVGLTFKKGSLTQFTKGHSRRRGYANRSLHDGKLIVAHMGASKKFVGCYRIKLDNFPSPILPTFQNPFSIVRAANAIALLKLAFASKAKPL